MYSISLMETKCHRVCQEMIISCILGERHAFPNYIISKLQSSQLLTILRTITIFCFASKVLCLHTHTSFKRRNDNQRDIYLNVNKGLSVA